MSRLYACIISDDVKQSRETLLSIAGKFSHSIRMLDDGVLFDVGKLERLIGNSETIAQKILAEVNRYKISANVAVADTVDTAILLAKQQTGNERSLHLSDAFEQLPLSDLDIEQDTLNVFDELGLRRVADLLAVPRKELIGRYGRGFQKTIDTIEQKGRSILTPNIKENKVSWSFDLDRSVENFEQLIFVLNHGLERLFAQVDHCGFSVEHLDLFFSLKDKTKRSYEIKTSFPTLERSFWLKLINLRVALDPPGADIVSVGVVTHFAKARPAQRGLYAVSHPEPESLLLTVNKLKKLVGENNVGIPVLPDQRLSEPFAIDADAIPEGKEYSVEDRDKKPVIAFTYFRPPLKADIESDGSQFIYLTTRNFSGPIVKYSGVWRSGSKWWEKPWMTNEWDIEVEKNGVYRLRKTNEEWVLVGEYD